ncbi:MAG: hypothetical protein AAB559_02450 [Patescibacteria group bacterium]
MNLNNYGGLIWTNHALQRLSERGIKQGDAWAVWNRPDQSRYSKTQGAWIYYKTWPASTGKAGEYTRIEVVAKQNINKKWIILSVWSKKVFSFVKNIKSNKNSLLTMILNLFKVK